MTHFAHIIKTFSMKCCLQPEVKQNKVSNKNNLTGHGT